MFNIGVDFLKTGSNNTNKTKYFMYDNFVKTWNYEKIHNIIDASPRIRKKQLCEKAHGIYKLWNPYMRNYWYLINAHKSFKTYSFKVDEIATVETSAVFLHLSKRLLFGLFSAVFSSSTRFTLTKNRFIIR